MAGDYSAKPDDETGFTKVMRKGKKVTFPFEEPSGHIEEIQDNWDDDDKPKPETGSITPIAYIDQVIASHAPSHMRDRPTREKVQHVEDEVSRLKQHLEDFKSMSDRTKRSDKSGKPERAGSPVVIDLVTPEVHQAGSPEVASL